MREQAKLNDRQVIRIREMRHKGMLPMEIAAEFKLTPGYVGQVCRGETYKHVGGPITVGTQGVSKSGMSKQVTASQIADMLAMRKTGMSYAAIGKAVGYSMPTVLYAMRAAGDKTDLRTGSKRKNTTK